MKQCLVAAIAASSWLSVSSTSFANQPENLVEQANQCRQIPARLDRLTCFDAVFATPLEEHTSLAADNSYPSEWNRAIEARDDLEPGEGWALVVEGKGKEGSAWVALPAQNTMFAEQDAPVLLLSCINNLSRVELALPQEAVDARIQVSVRGAMQYWRSDDDGVLFSSARGLPAIDMMKRIANDPYLTLRSNSDFADGLQFNTRDLKHGLRALRERCGW
ncbi:type VI secretion-related protein VasI [Aliivibrio wodanis]|uniref:Type VI secretion-related protein VasI n=1 Tax=Aliivibrio wodanis TaxID=80852 RepID=A0A090JZ92_9GAMM|nr:type VI secretion-related protein VasI [Aliivibrio wodanis]